jgi:ribosomal 50S subunit-recycling heat shock protein
MRIDLLLNKLCLTKTRSVAKNACDRHLVWINNKTAKASHEVHAGDLIRFHLYGYKHELKILQIPQGNISKKDTTQFYQLLDKSPLE